MIKVAEADRAIVAAQEYARDHGYSISVTGQLLPPAGLGIPSGEKSDMNLERPSVSGVLAHGLAVFVGPRLPIKRGGEVEGAIGVSGAPTVE
jgi:hypothetical protein